MTLHGMGLPPGRDVRDSGHPESVARWSSTPRLHPSISLVDRTS